MWCRFNYAVTKIVHTTHKWNLLIYFASPAILALSSLQTTEPKPDWPWRSCVISCLCLLRLQACTTMPDTKLKLMPKNSSLLKLPNLSMNMPILGTSNRLIYRLFSFQNWIWRTVFLKAIKIFGGRDKDHLSRETLYSICSPLPQSLFSQPALCTSDPVPIYTHRNRPRRPSQPGLHSYLSTLPENNGEVISLKLSQFQRGFLIAEIP